MANDRTSTHRTSERLLCFKGFSIPSLSLMSLGKICRGFQDGAWASLRRRASPETTLASLDQNRFVFCGHLLATFYPKNIFASQKPLALELSQGRGSVIDRASESEARPHESPAGKLWRGGIAHRQRTYSEWHFSGLMPTESSPGVSHICRREHTLFQRPTHQWRTS